MALPTGHITSKEIPPGPNFSQDRLENGDYMLYGVKAPKLHRRRRGVLVEVEKKNLGPTIPNVKRTRAVPLKQIGGDCPDELGSEGFPLSGDKGLDSDSLVVPRLPPPPTPHQLMASGSYHPDKHTLTQHIESLHAKYWNKGDAGRMAIYSTETHQLGEETEVFSLMNLGPGFETFFGGRSTIIVRDVFKEMSAALPTPSAITYGAVIIGQPGIGKSTFIHYLLVERVLSGKRTMFQCHPDTIYEICNGGVKARPAFGFLPLSSPDWALVDTSDSLPFPSLDLQDAYFTIAAFKPAPVDWQRWCYSQNATICVVKPWSEHEIVYAGLRVCSPPLGADRLQDAFLNHGPSPRLCFCFAQHSQCMAEWKQATIRTISEVAARDPNLFAASYFDTKEWDHPSLYHQVFLVGLSETCAPQLSIITPPVVRLITEEIGRRGGPKIWEEFNMFKDPSYDDSGRRIWASHSMSAIVEGEMRQTKLHYITRPLGADCVLESVELTLPLPNPLPYDSLESWPQELHKAQACPILFQPKARNEDTFDAILVAPTHIAFFETTIYYHIRTSITKIYQRLDALVGALQAASKAERLPSESYKWRLVFLVPKHDLTEWESGPRWRTEFPESSWKEHLDLFVFSPEAGVLEVKKSPPENYPDFPPFLGILQY